MKIVFFTHPDFLGHQSMPRFTKMLADGMKKRGHDIEVWKPSPKFYNLSVNKSTRKWMGYIDQFIVFPKQVKNNLKNTTKNTLYVIIDQALGPWVPLISNKAHIVHCHDFLAQFSSLGYIKKNPTSVTGKMYQKFIWRGYSQAKNFISVSKKTKDDLLRLLPTRPKVCEVVYNGLNQAFIASDISRSRKLLANQTGIVLDNGFILHVGGNQWYKNRLGVIDIYDSWRKITNNKLPLLLVGEKPSTELLEKREISDYADNIFFLDKISDEIVRAAYCGASLLLYPSIAEGFGWPIAEAMASGCIVITTNEEPMIEVAGEAGFFIPLIPDNINEMPLWANEAAHKIEHVLNLSLKEKEDAVKAGIENAKRFETDAALDKIEKIYIEILMLQYKI